MSHFLGTYFKRQPFLCVSSFLPPSRSLEQSLWGQGSHLGNGWKESGSLRALPSRAASPLLNCLLTTTINARQKFHLS